MSKGLYKYSNRRLIDWLETQRNTFKQKHGFNINGLTAEAMLLDKVLIPNNINLSDTLKTKEINLKWKKLRLKL